jgi:polysaccharide biosynthesis protein PslJ
MAIHSIEPTTAVGAEPAVRLRRSRLPTGWPLLAILVLFPLWYVLGLGGFIWIILAVPMFVHLIIARTWRVPRGFFIWLFFLGWIALSSIQISHSTNWLTYGYRTASYLAATVVFIYVVNTDEKDLPTEKIIKALTIFWVVIVVGGYLGLALPDFAFSTPAGKLLGSLGSNRLLVALVHPRLTQAEALGGTAAIGHAIPRPAAPFAYTNWWGANFAFLVPFVILAFRRTESRRMRAVLIGLLAASLVPFIYSINRGAWLSLAVGGLYTLVRFAGRRRGRRAAIGGVALLVVLAGATMVTPLGGVIQARLGHAGSASLRLSLYQQSAQGVSQSPVVGYGVPLPQPVSQYTLPNIGTQGQLWLVLVSVGVPGLIFFLAWLLYVFWVSRSPDDPVSFAVHVSILVGLIQLPFYGWMPTEMFLVMIVAAFVWRNREQHVPADRPLEAAYPGPPTRLG